jgi:hypothetical protein
MVASRVYIQSGNFSFYFQHRPGDSGIGMISPTWQEATDSLPDTVTTRMTLHLHDSDQRGPSEVIRNQFEDLEATMLLFLRNIRRIVVSIYDEHEEIEQETTFSISKVSKQRARLIKEVQYGLADEYTAKDYHVTRHTATNLARDKDRDYSESEIVLAFPLTEDSIPALEKQQIYAFLPVQKAGFDVSFTISSRYDTCP